MLAAAQTPFGSPGRSASAEAAAKAAAKAALEAAETAAATQTLEGGVEANEGGASQAAAKGAAMAVEVAAPAAQALADYYYSTADEKETDAIETICNSKSPINKAHAIYYFKNQEYFIDYCNEFVFLSNENPLDFTEYKRLNDFLQREKFIEEIKKKDTDLIKKTYNMLLCNIPSAKYDYYLYDCLREVIDDKELFYSGPTDDVFDDGLKKSHIFYYLQYIE